MHDNYFVLREIFVADLLLTLRFARSIDICDKDPVVHKHTPYIVILVGLAEKWADAHDGQLPSTRQEKREFKVHDLLGLLADKLNRFLWSLTKLLFLPGPNLSRMLKPRVIQEVVQFYTVLLIVQLRKNS